MEGCEMMPYSNTYNVLLPKTILQKRKELDFQQFLDEVRTYMRRYPHYIVDTVEDCFAVCIRVENQDKRSSGMI